MKNKEQLVKDKNNTGTTDLRTLQLRMLKIFLEFERICLEHNLRFWLSSGTMLGAIRHKGFIPWDDDMDVSMSRKDYETLIKHASEWFTYPYEMDCREINPNYPYRFGKIYDSSTTVDEKRVPGYVGGVYLDIFPFDGLPNNRIRQKLHLWKHRKLERLFFLSYRDPFKHGKRLDSYLVVLLQKIISSNWAYRKLKQTTTKYDFSTSKFVTDHGFKLRSIYNKEILGDKPRKVTFENHETFGFKDNDKYLTIIYGEYMKLPPLEKRKKHSRSFVDLNLPYREYLKKQKSE